MNTIFKQLRTDTGYLLSSLPIAIPAFVITIAGFAAGLGTAVIWIGVPILAATLYAMRGLATAGRLQLAAVLGQPVPAPHYRHTDKTGLRRFLSPIADGQSWLNLLWGLVNFPLAITGFVVALTMWAATLASLTYPLYSWIIRGATGEADGIEHATRWLGWGDSYLAVSTLAVLGGLVLAALLPLLLRLFALTQASLGRALLASLSEADTPHHEIRSAVTEAEVVRIQERLTTV
ncbi:sensor domain-containing protein [Glycomyces sp. NPDC046736]|uniref:sensor domain-containing protein n=1 Tax=Glycomyces sp. NPDC046736 TaxID=3155615 RepID=UPI0033C2EDB5